VKPDGLNLVKLFQAHPLTDALRRGSHLSHNSTFKEQRVVSNPKKHASAFRGQNNPSAESLILTRHLSGPQVKYRVVLSYLCAHVNLSLRPRTPVHLKNVERLRISEPRRKHFLGKNTLLIDLTVMTNTLRSLIFLDDAGDGAAG
jgi:hypothetical protein